MTVGELIERLTELAQENGEDAEVRLATQPSWPLAYCLAGATSNQELEDLREEPSDEEEEVEAVVWLVEGGSPQQPYSPYAPRACWDAL